MEYKSLTTATETTEVAATLASFNSDENLPKPEIQIPIEKTRENFTEMEFEKKRRHEKTYYCKNDE